MDWMPVLRFLPKVGCLLSSLSMKTAVFVDMRPELLFLSMKSAFSWTEA